MACHTTPPKSKETQGQTFTYFSPIPREGT